MAGVALVPVLVWPTFPDWYRWMWTGAVLASAGWLLWLTVVQLDGSYSYRVGALGEEWTEEVLRKLAPPWRVRSNVSFGAFDVDHVAVGPTGVLAVESKWTSGEWDIAASRLDPYLKSKISQARERAKAVATVVGPDVVVHPVLVCWGPRVRRVDRGGSWIDGVFVAVGGQSKEWLTRLTPQLLDEAAIERAWGAVSSIGGR
jgi:hypothetical protein